jgi:hypothetical protein
MIVRRERIMSIEDLVTRLVAAARGAFTRARQMHPGESFYCYALYTMLGGLHRACGHAGGACL